MKAGENMGDVKEFSLDVHDELSDRTPLFFMPSEKKLKKPKKVFD